MKGNYIRFIILLPLYLIWGCSGEQQEQAKPPTPPPASTAKPTPAAPPASAVAPLAANKTQISAFGLIPPTNAQERLKGVKANRNNPFAVMAVTVVPDGQKAAAATGSPDTSPAGGKKGTKAGKGGDKEVKPSQLWAGKYCQWDGNSVGAIIEIQPEEAQGVFVSGIVKFPDAVYAIVTPRNSSLSQYVKQGTIFGNGVVRVAAIDALNETVTLEENGRFVYREIGQKPLITKTDALSGGFEIVKPQGNAAFGVVRRGQQSLMLTQASILIIQLGGESNAETFQQLVRPGGPRNAPADPVAVPVPVQPTPPASPAPAPPTEPAPAPQGQGANNPPDPNIIPKSTRLSGTICNDGDKRISVTKIKVQIQDAETGTVLDTAWNEVASTSVVLDSGQKAEFDFSVPKLEGRRRGRLSVKLLDWQGG